MHLRRACLRDGERENGLAMMLERRTEAGLAVTPQIEEPAATSCHRNEVDAAALAHNVDPESMRLESTADYVINACATRALRLSIPGFRGDAARAQFLGHYLAALDSGSTPRFLWMSS